MNSNRRNADAFEDNDEIYSGCEVLMIINIHNLFNKVCKCYIREVAREQRQIGQDRGKKVILMYTHIYQNYLISHITTGHGIKRLESI